MATEQEILEIELALKKLIEESYTRYVLIRSKRLYKADPKLKQKYTPAKLGKILAFIMWKYEAMGLIRVQYITQNHLYKFYVYVTEAYDDYAEKLEKQLQPQPPQAPTPTTS
ncbi:MAG: hypothetical protein JHC26_11620 [Thermofilum sp.]|uniref:hypothetical protein n=1 Tax=Thermofilum sp. TaxID=1961369 RepID=UPI002584CBE9|nr:hypothetical protein [Thermofilum sp.]MCI4409731.1 hypothetical protein [Thermofilum sp.]